MQRKDNKGVKGPGLIEVQRLRNDDLPILNHDSAIIDQDIVSDFLKQVGNKEQVRTSGVRAQISLILATTVL